MPLVPIECDSWSARPVLTCATSCLTSTLDDFPGMGCHATHQRWPISTSRLAPPPVDHGRLLVSWAIPPGPSLLSVPALGTTCRHRVNRSGRPAVDSSPSDGGAEPDAARPRRTSLGKWSKGSPPEAQPRLSQASHLPSALQAP